MAGQSALTDPYARVSAARDTPFADLVHCPACTSSRPMIIKTLRPGLTDIDRIVYRCTACGAEKTEPPI